MDKIYWASRHDLSSAQNQAIIDLHGKVKIVKDPAKFDGDEGLADYIREHNDGFVYAVASGVHYLTAGLSGLPFGIFTNHPDKRADGKFGLASVHWVNSPVKGITRVWVNPDPASDYGEALIPVARPEG